MGELSGIPEHAIKDIVVSLGARSVHTTQYVHNLRSLNLILIFSDFMQGSFYLKSSFYNLISFQTDSFFSTLLLLLVRATKFCFIH